MKASYRTRSSHGRVKRSARNSMLLHEMNIEMHFATCGTEKIVEKRSIHIISIASRSIEPIA